MSTYCKKFLALYFSLECFSLFIWGAEKPVIVLTDNKSLTNFFQSKLLHPALWTFMDRVIAYNNVLPHIPGRAKAAADFLSNMQTDPSQTLELQLLDSIPMKQVAIDMKAKTPDASMFSIEQPETQQKEPNQPGILRDLLYQLHTNDTLQNLMPNLNEILDSASPKETIELYSLIRTSEFNSIQDKDPLHYFETKNSNTGVMDIQTEQQKDPALRKVISWIQNGCDDDITYASFEFKKYHKHLSRLQIQKSIVMR